MAIPEITYPVSLDTDNTLYFVRDSLTIPLAKDYTPGDKFIFVSSDIIQLNRFPETGIITLTENCSKPNERAVSFYYGSRNVELAYFTDLTVLPETPDTLVRRAIVTNVSMNVTAQHHNNIKNAILSIENYIGKESDTSTQPFIGNIVQRTKFLFETVFTPRAWFVADVTLGVVPMTVEFASYSLYLGQEIDDNVIQYTWDFGDGSPVESGTGLAYQIRSHTYLNPGLYTVTLTVQNNYGTDTVTFDNMIRALYIAPYPAVITMPITGIQQYFTTDGNNFLKTPANVYVTLFTTNQQMPDEPYRTFSGEHLSGNTVIDPIETFTWNLSDTLSHANSLETKALYNVGGIYQVVLRCDTLSGAYRITTNPMTINVIERQNAWLFITPPSQPVGTVYASEFGFLNETFKYLQTTNTTYSTNSDFLTNPPVLQEARILSEFKQNTNLNALASIPSGFAGYCVISYASGRSSTAAASTETINMQQFNGYLETYINPAYTSTVYRPWNWIAFNNTGVVYYLFGNAVNQQPYNSLTNLDLQQTDLADGATSVSKTFSPASFIGQANYLTYNQAEYDTFGASIYGNYSAYRTAWRGRTGYILKNMTIGSDFRINSFYNSIDSGTELFSQFGKLPNMSGPVKTQGQLVNLTTALFFFNNSGNVMAFDTNTNVWKTGGPGLNSIAFANLQDNTKTNYDNENNPLLVTTDFGDNAFISFNYSPNSMIKYNDVDLTFTKLSSRPAGEQWIFGSY
jgi:PKD repeat protein